MSCSEVVEHVCGMLDHLAARAGIELTLFTDPAIPPVLRGDPLRVRQILVNLASNAIKFSSALPRTGRVEVRSRLMTCDAQCAWVEFSVRDNGIGIAAATQARRGAQSGQGRAARPADRQSHRGCGRRTPSRGSSSRGVRAACS